MGVKKDGCFQRAPGSCALDASSFLLPIPRRERRATRVVGETRSSGSVGVHHVDILIDERIPCIRLRKRYLFAIRRPGGFVFYDGLGTGEVSLAGAVSFHHVEATRSGGRYRGGRRAIDKVYPGCPHEGYLLAIGRPYRRFEANLEVPCVRGSDEPCLTGAVGVHHVDVVVNLAAGVAASQVGYLLAVGRPRGGAF